MPDQPISSYATGWPPIPPIRTSRLDIKGVDHVGATLILQPRLNSAVQRVGVLAPRWALSARSRPMSPWSANAGGRGGLSQGVPTSGSTSAAWSNSAWMWTMRPDPGVPKDDAEARKYTLRACCRRCRQCPRRHRGDLMTLSGSAGSASDPAAEARGDACQGGRRHLGGKAQFQLGLMMAQGTGGPQDDVGARAMFEKAAAQNHPGALEWMGSFQANGRGDPEG